MKERFRRACTTRRDCLRLATAGLVAAALPTGARAANDTAGYEVLDLDWADTARQRPVPARLYLPATPQRVPLMVFSHGLGGSRLGYSWLGRHVASHGIASLHIQHVGSDRQLWGGSMFSIVGRLQAAAQDSEAIARALDLRFALDTLLDPAQSDSRAARIDSSRIVAAGHSYGANTTLLASGARVERQGRLIDLHDARVRAAIAISAPPFYGDSDARKILAAIAVPSLHVTATEDVIRIPGYYSGVEDRLAVFDAMGSPRKWLAVYEGGSHSMFTDRGGTGGVALNPQVKTATQALVLAFLHEVFDGDESELAAWPQRNAALLARFTAGRA
jgi:predicted dienelactone hydrolase